MGIKIRSVSVINTKKQKRITLYVSSDVSLNINDMLSIEYKGNTYYFRPEEITEIEAGTTSVLTEYGFWQRRLYMNKDACYRDLLGEELQKVTDKEVIKKVDLENTFC